jgi:hypothetical protein
VKNLVRGRTLKLTEKHKTDVEWQNKVWEGIKAACHNPEILKMIEEGNNVGNDKLFSRIFGSSVTTLTGRVRGYVTFTQACNTPFSGIHGLPRSLSVSLLFIFALSLMRFFLFSLVGVVQAWRRMAPSWRCGICTWSATASLASSTTRYAFW